MRLRGGAAQGASAAPEADRGEGDPLETGDVSPAREPAQQVARVDAEPLEEPSVAVGVDLVGQLLLGSLRLILLASLAEEIEDGLLVDLHGCVSSCDGRRLAERAGRLPTMDVR